MFIGIDIGGTKCAVVKGETDDTGNIKITAKVKADTKTLNPDTALEFFVNTVKDMCVSGEKPEAIGISCGGPLDSREGVIMSPPNLPGWDDVHIVNYMTEALDVPAFLENDANACALAEWKYGAGKGTKNMIFLTFGTGLGAGIILDGKLYGGTNGMAGEVGHIRLSAHGPAGYGKCGSFEGFCSGGGIASLASEMAREAMQRGILPSYCIKENGKSAEITAKSVAQAARDGDETALKVYRICGEKLGEGLSILIDVLNPEVIVIGSVFARSRDLLWKHARKVITSEALTQSISVCRVVPAKLGDSIGDYAALAIAHTNIEQK